MKSSGLWQPLVVPGVCTGGKDLDRLPCFSGFKDSFEGPGAILLAAVDEILAF